MIVIRVENFPANVSPAQLSEIVSEVLQVLITQEIPGLTTKRQFRTVYGSARPDHLNNSDDTLITVETWRPYNWTQGKLEHVVDLIKTSFSNKLGNVAVLYRGFNSATNHMCRTRTRE